MTTIRPQQRTKSVAQKKRELHHRSTQHKSAISSDIRELTFDLERWGKNFLVITGSLYVVYKLLKLVKGSDKDEAREDKLPAVVNRGESSVIVSKIKEQIALFLLAIALRKLKDFLHERRERDQHT